MALPFVWTIEDLGPWIGLLDPSSSSETSLGAVNDLGTVVGFSMGHVFMIDSSVVTDVHPTGAHQTYGFDINNAGEIVGMIDLPDGTRRGFVRDASGTISYLQKLAPGSMTWAAHGIRDDGAVIGSENAPPFLPPPQVANSRAMQWGPPLPTSTTVPVSLHDAALHATSAVAINNSGQVAGRTYAGPNHPGFAALYDSGQWTSIDPSPATRGEASDLNVDGVVVGTSFIPGHQPTAFVYEQGFVTILDPGLGQPGGLHAHGVSDAGDVVGRGRKGTGVDWSRHVAFLWNRTHGFNDLNELIPPNTGWMLESAEAISPRGRYIVGQGHLNGQARVFRIHRENISIPFYPQLRVPEIPHAWVYAILHGVVLDQGGVFVGPRGPDPVPPWGERPHPPMTAGMSEVLRTLAVHELTRLIPDPELRRKVQPLLLKSAIDRLKQLERIAGMAGESARVERRQQPSAVERGENPRRKRTRRKKK